VLAVRELLIAANQDYNAPQGVNNRSAPKGMGAAGFTYLKHHRVRINGEPVQLWVRDPSGLLGKLSGDQIRERYLLELNRPKMGAAA
jgi:hypothetical protein